MARFGRTRRYEQQGPTSHVIVGRVGETEAGRDPERYLAAVLTEPHPERTYDSTEPRDYSETSR